MAESTGGRAYFPATKRNSIPRTPRSRSLSVMSTAWRLHRLSKMAPSTLSKCASALRKPQRRLLLPIASIIARDI